MSDQEFRVLLDLWMVSDPWPLDPEANTILTQMLTREAIDRGHEDLITAYHSHSGAR